MAATIPDSGIVTNHAMTIERATPQFTALIRLEAPTPNKEPLTHVWYLQVNARM